MRHHPWERSPRKLNFLPCFVLFFNHLKNSSCKQHDLIIYLDLVLLSWQSFLGRKIGYLSQDMGSRGIVLPLPSALTFFFPSCSTSPIPLVSFFFPLLHWENKISHCKYIFFICSKLVIQKL